MKHVSKREKAISLSSALIILASVIIFSCKKQNQQPLNASPISLENGHFPSLENDQFDTISKKSTWQDQLNFVKLKRTVLSKNGIQLVNYQQLGKINSTENVDFIISKILSDQSIFPVHDSLNFYHISPIHKISSGKLSVTTLRNHLDTLIKPEMEEIKVNWICNGENFSSICIVSAHKGVVYDNLMSNVFALSIKKYINNNALQPFNASIVRQVTLNETPNPNPKYTFMSGDLKTSNLFGYGAEAQVRFTVYGTLVNGQKSITNYDSDNFHTADPGYSADASTTVTSFVAGTNGHCAFSWGVLIGTSSGFTLGWNGTSYTYPSSSTGNSGQQYVIPSSLN